MNERSYAYVHSCLHPSRVRNENTEEVEELLELIKYIRRNNRCTMEMLIKNASEINFDEHTLSTYITILDTFPNTRAWAKQLKDVEATTFYITRMISSLERLKYQCKYGELYYHIIVGKVCDEEVIKDQVLANKYGIARSTLYLKKIEALNQTYEIWFADGLLDEAALSTELYKSTLKMLRDEG